MDLAHKNKESIEVQRNQYVRWGHSLTMTVIYTSMHCRWRNRVTNSCTRLLYPRDSGMLLSSDCICSNMQHEQHYECLTAKAPMVLPTRCRCIDSMEALGKETGQNSGRFWITTRNFCLGFNIPWYYHCIGYRPQQILVCTSSRLLHEQDRSSVLDMVLEPSALMRCSLHCH